MANIVLDIQEPIIDGQLLVFTAPCDCDEATKIKIGTNLYTLVDAAENSLLGKKEFFVKDSRVSVIIDTTRRKAYLQNAAVIPYKPNILFNTEDFTTPNIATHDVPNLGIAPIGIGAYGTPGADSSLYYVAGEGFKVRGKYGYLAIPISHDDISTVGEDNPITVTLLTNEGVESFTFTESLPQAALIGDTSIEINIITLTDSDYLMGFDGFERSGNFFLVLQSMTQSGSLVIKAIKAEYSSFFTGWSPKPFDNYLFKAYTDTKMTEAVKGQNLLFNPYFAYNSSLSSDFAKAGWNYNAETSTNIFSPMGIRVNPAVVGTIAEQELSVPVAYPYQLTVEWKNQNDNWDIKYTTTLEILDAAEIPITIAGVVCHIVATHAHFHIRIKDAQPDATPFWINALKLESNSVPTPLVPSAEEGHRIRTLINMIYPVGSIYMSTVDANPGTWLGGTWVAWGSGRVPVGVNTSDTNFNTVEKTGGEKTHTLTTAEMPSHTHSHASHSHTVQYMGTDWPGDKKIYADFTTETGSVHKTLTLNASGAETSEGILQERIVSTEASPLTTSSANITIGKTGSGNAHNNLQPYITCYMWKRTA